MNHSKNNIKNGIYLICNMYGEIEQVLYDDLELIDIDRLPISFQEIITKESIGKASDFWTEIENKQIVFGYDLYVNNGKIPLSLNFTAAKFNQRIWVIGSSQNKMMSKILDEMMFIINEQQNIIRRAEKSISEFKKQEKFSPINAFDEITQVNNELVNVQRTLYKQNEEITRLNNDLEESNKELQSFAYALSHDLKEPLRMVRSFMKLLKDKYRPQLDDKAKQYIDYAVDGAERMNDLISDLLNYSRIGRQNTSLKQINIQHILDKVLKLNTSFIESEQATIEIGEMPSLNCQRIPMEQVFNNLISNSLKYRNPDIKPIIKIEAKEKKDHWLFSVSDNGLGIPAELHSEIFDLFRRGDHADSTGSGMGLAICKKIVEHHGGEIWVESEEDSGCVFYFTIAK